MERKQNNNSIRLRFLVFKKDNKYEAICLDTNIANRANTIKLLEQKIMDSSVLYIRSFSKTELESKAYIRKAPIKYRLIWYMPNFTYILFHKSKKNQKAELDPTSGKLSFA